MKQLSIVAILAIAVLAPNYTRAQSTTGHLYFSGISNNIVPFNQEYCFNMRYVLAEAGGDTSVIVNSVKLVGPPVGFTITSITPTLPFELTKGSEMIVRICVTTTDTNAYVDQLQVITNNGEVLTPITITPNLNKFIAGDLDFGEVTQGVSTTNSVSIYNYSQYPLTVTGYTVEGNADLTVDAVNSFLPRTIPPRKFDNFYVNYLPKDEGSDMLRINWLHNFEAPFDQGYKPYSILRGRTPGSAGVSGGENNPFASLTIRQTGLRTVVEIDLVQFQSNARLNIFSVDGKPLANYAINGQHAVIEIPRDQLPAGTYLVRLSSAGGSIDRVLQLLK